MLLALASHVALLDREARGRNSWLLRAAGPLLYLAASLSKSTALPLPASVPGRCGTVPREGVHRREFHPRSVLKNGRDGSNALRGSFEPASNGCPSMRVGKIPSKPATPQVLALDLALVAGLSLKRRLQHVTGYVLVFAALVRITLRANDLGKDPHADVINLPLVSQRAAKALVTIWFCLLVAARVLTTGPRRASRDGPRRASRPSAFVSFSFEQDTALGARRGHVREPLGPRAPSPPS